MKAGKEGEGWGGGGGGSGSDIVFLTSPPSLKSLSKAKYQINEGNLEVDV